MSDISSLAGMIHHQIGLVLTVKRIPRLALATTCSHPWVTETFMLGQVINARSSRELYPGDLVTGTIFDVDAPPMYALVEKIADSSKMMK